jgi:hypothetical protein
VRPEICARKDAISVTAAPTNAARERDVALQVLHVGPDRRDAGLFGQRSLGLQLEEVGSEL